MYMLGGSILLRVTAGFNRNCHILNPNFTFTPNLYNAVVDPDHDKNIKKLKELDEAMDTDDDLVFSGEDSQMNSQVT